MRNASSSSRKWTSIRYTGHEEEGGIPLALCINPGSTAEITTLKPLEDKLHEKFGISKVVTCTAQQASEPTPR